MNLVYAVLEKTLTSAEPPISCQGKPWAKSISAVSVTGHGHLHGAYLSHFAPGTVLDLKHFAFAMLQALQAAPHLLMGGLGGTGFGRDSMSGSWAHR